MRSDHRFSPATATPINMGVVEPHVRGLPINLPAEQLWLNNSVVSGTHSRYVVEPVVGTLSIKTVRKGSAHWTTSEGRYTVDEGSFLILNEGQTYSLELKALEPVQTYCVFLKPGFLESVWSSLKCSADGLLLDEDVSPRGFFERLNPYSPAIGSRMTQIWERRNDHLTDLEAENLFIELAKALIGVQQDSKLEPLRLDQAMPATREELHKRLNLGRDYILSNLHLPMKLEQISSAACLSSFHFHRLFTTVFKQTPHSFVTRQRIARAERLLSQTRLSVEQIAWSCGVDDANGFSALFKRATGRTPTAFRQNSGM